MEKLLETKLFSIQTLRKGIFVNQDIIRKITLSMNCNSHAVVVAIHINESKSNMCYSNLPVSVCSVYFKLESFTLMKKINTKFNLSYNVI